MKDAKNKKNNAGEDEVVVEDDAETTEDVLYEEEGESAKDTIKKLREKLATTEKEKMEYLESMQRNKADYINARKRDDEAKIELTRYANLSFAEEMLPTLDSFEQAMANKETWETVSAEWRTGVESIYNKLISVFNKNNIASYGKIGDTFDPVVHHSIQVVPTDDKALDATISAVLQKGYKMGDKLIRPALVSVYEYNEFADSSSKSAEIDENLTGTV